VFPVIFEPLIPGIARFARLSVLVVLQKSLIDEAGFRVRDWVEATKLMRDYGSDVNLNPLDGIKGRRASNACHTDINLESPAGLCLA
jgi:hypothetical protein